MEKKKIFVSYHPKYDMHYKLMLLAWKDSLNFELQFSDQLDDVQVNDKKSFYNKTKISKKMDGTSHCLVIIGKNTYKNDWITWEIENAYNLGLKIVAVKINKTCISPVVLDGKKIVWADNFSPESLLKAINES